MGETIAAMRARAAAEGDGAPADLPARRAAQAAFLKRVGWR
jgi:hypothetical protein